MPVRGGEFLNIVMFTDNTNMHIGLTHTHTHTHTQQSNAVTTNLVVLTRLYYLVLLTKK